MRARKSCQLNAARFSLSKQNSSEISKVNHEQCPFVNVCYTAGALLTLPMNHKVYRNWAWTSLAQYSLFICVSRAQLSLPYVALGKKATCLWPPAKPEPTLPSGVTRGGRKFSSTTWWQTRHRTGEFLCHIQPWRCSLPFFLSFSPLHATSIQDIYLLVQTVIAISLDRLQRLRSKVRTLM